MRVLQIGPADAGLVQGVAQRVGKYGKVYVVESTTDRAEQLAGQLRTGHVGNVEVLSGDPSRLELPDRHLSTWRFACGPWLSSPAASAPCGSYSECSDRPASWRLANRCGRVAFSRAWTLKTGRLMRWGWNVAKSTARRLLTRQPSASSTDRRRRWRLDAHTALTTRATQA